MKELLESLGSLLIIISQTLVYVLIAPGVAGTLLWLKARLQGRQGPSPLQPYFDLWKLLHRRAVTPETASWVFSAAPLVVFGCYVLIGAQLPIVYLPSFEQAIGKSWGAPIGDFVVIIYLIGLARFAIGLAGMDSGSPYGGMGSGREMFLHVLTEPALIIAAFAMAFTALSTSLSAMMNSGVKNQDFIIDDPSILFLALALAIVMMAEAERIPFDNPETNLELTMTGKAIELEYGGYHLALLQWASAMRLTLFITLLVNLVVPAWMANASKTLPWTVLSILFYPFRLFLLIILLAFWELLKSKMRLRAVAGPGGLALSFSILAVLLAIATHYFIY